MIKVTIVHPPNPNKPDEVFFVRANGPIDQFAPKGEARGYSQERGNKKVKREKRSPFMIEAMDLLETDSISPHVVTDADGEFAFPDLIVEGKGGREYHFSYVERTEEPTETEV